MKPQGQKTRSKIEMMKKQIINIAPHQFAKSVALVLGLLLSPGIPIGVIILLTGGKDRVNGLFFILAPIAYAMAWYLWCVVLAALYNVISKRFGGIEITIQDVEQTP
jgi:hypothetical protein